MLFTEKIGKCVLKLIEATAFIFSLLYDLIQSSLFLSSVCLRERYALYNTVLWHSRPGVYENKPFFSIMTNIH